MSLAPGEDEENHDPQGQAAELDDLDAEGRLNATLLTTSGSPGRKRDATSLSREESGLPSSLPSNASMFS